MQREDPEASEGQTLRMATRSLYTRDDAGSTRGGGGPQLLRFFLRRGAEIKLRVRSGRATARASPRRLIAHSLQTNFARICLIPYARTYT